MRRTKGFLDLFFDTVENITNLVERTHNSAASKVFRPLAIAGPAAIPARATKIAHNATAASVYRIIRSSSRSVERLASMGYQLAAAREAGVVRANADKKVRLVDHTESVLNAFYGDYLHKRQNVLDLGMSLRHQGQTLAIERQALKKAFPDASGKIVVFIHGLACTEWTWNISAQDFYGDPDVNFGSKLKGELDYTPVFVRYNTGRHISENGQLLSTLLSQLFAEYPRDLEEIVLIGHSMGGLLARSAARIGATQNEDWTDRLKHIVCLGTPNLGAPLEKGVNILTNLLRVFDTAGTRVPAEILNARSAGIKDLRFGYTDDAEWKGQNPDSLLENNRHAAPLVDGVGYYFVAATVTRSPKHPMGVIIGDLLVRLPSATGQSAEPTRSIPFQSGQILSGMSHLHIANHPQVYEIIKQYL